MVTRLFAKQPKALVPLFFIELWERFGFYVVQTVLVLYLTKVFHLSDQAAYSIFGISSAFMYATPFIGGYLADSVLGYRNSILLGAVLLACGYWLLMVPGSHFFYFALAFIVIGNGFFKSCISTVVGMLYDDHDSRRDAGFTLFYMGINIGSFVGPIMAGFVSVSLGWSFVFGFTGFGLVIAMLIAIMTFKKLGDKGLPPPIKPFLLGRFVISKRVLVILGALLAAGLFADLIRHHEFANKLFLLICAGCVLSIFIFSFRCYKQERRNMIVLIVLLLFSILYWSVYVQMFASLNLFADRIVNRHLFSYEVPTALFQAVNPFFIIVLTPFLVKLWPYLERRQHALAQGTVKFALALALIGFGYVLLIIGMLLHAPDGHVNMFWLSGNYFILTVGELCLSPIGLSLMSSLAPNQYKSVMMGAWMLSISAGYNLGDYLAQISSVPADLLNNSILSIEHFYTRAFVLFAILALGAAALLWTLSPFLNKMLKPLTAKGG